MRNRHSSIKVIALFLGTVLFLFLAACEVDKDGTRTGTPPVPPSDSKPSFSGTIADQTYTQGTAIRPLTLPGATGGDGSLTYMIIPTSPAGLSFNSITRVLSGTPNETGSIDVIYLVEDADGDADMLSFTIVVNSPADPDFGSQTIEGQSYINGIVITPLDLPEAYGGTPPLEYSLTGLPAGLRLENRQLVGTPAEVVTGRTVTYTATDSDGDEDTLTFIITVAANAAPGFGSETIGDQSYIEGTAITTLTLPEAATGGNGDLAYSIVPASPFGLTFNPSTKMLSGTPASAGTAIITYKVVDADGDMTATDEDTLTFTITVAENTAPDFGSETIDDQSYIEGTAITTLTLPEATGGNGASTYSITPASPFGLTFDPLTRMLSGTLVSAGMETITYKVVDADGDMTAADEDTLTFTITVAANTPPDFGSETIDDQSYIEGTAIRTLTLPQAAGGNEDLSYSIAPASPFGLMFDPLTRMLSGTPVSAGMETITYKVVDGDGDTQATDEDTLTFIIRVAANDAPSFGSGTIADQNYINGIAITPLDLPEASGGNAPLQYSLTGLPAGLRLENRQLVGTPAEIVTAQTVTYTVMDADGDEQASDTDTLTFMITVDANDAPDFGSGTIDDQSYVEGTAIPTLMLPEAATGGNGDLRYSIAPASPFGLTFNSDTRELSGTPSGTGMETVTYKVVDADGDMTAADEDTITFTINVAEDTEPSFDGHMIGDLQYVPNSEITPVPLPQAVGGNPPLRYSLTTPPAGLTFNSDTRVLSGMPTTLGTTPMTYTVRDFDGDERTLTFTIEIIADAVPGFAGQTIDDQQYVQNAAITTFALPAATGGNGSLTYSLAPLPGGILFNSGTRELSGSPTTVGSTVLTYTARDEDGDEVMLTFMINVAADAEPSFGSETVPDQNYINGIAITPLDLPEATGGNAPLNYTLTGQPSGLSLTGGQLVGTPAEVVSGQTATYTATDVDGDEDTLTFTITVAANDAPDFGSETIDNQSYIEGTAITTLTLPQAATGGNGDLSYSITPASPFGLTFNPSTRMLSGTPASAGMETITYKVVDGDGDMTAADEDTLTFTITVAANDAPDFGSETIDNQNYIQGTEITTLTLPEAATGGNGDLSYSIAPASPFGLTFNPSTRMLSGTPASAGMETIMYKVVDADGDMTATDEDTLTFTITVTANDAPDFGSETIDAQNYVNGVAITPLDLPEATGGNGTLTYSITPASPFGLTFDSSTRQLSGTPVSAGTETITYKVVDADGDMTAADEDTLTFTITVAENTAPDFGSGTVDDQSYIEDTAIPTLTLPEAATGGNGILTYSITPASPFGLTFDSSTRQLSGTPVSAGTETITYKVVDADGDMTAADEDTITFTITVTANAAPDFGTQMISDQNYINGIAITPLDLPEATGGTPPLEYSFTGLPAGLRLGSGQLVGTPAEIVSGQTVTYTVTDADGDMTSGDEDTITFMITVAANTAPVFGSETIDDQSYIEGIAIPTLTLPAAATGGNGNLTYTITPASPFGLTFDPSTRQFSGTPASAGVETITYKVVDADGDMTAADEDTLTFTITVAENTAPDFGSGMVDDQSYIEDTAIPTLTLPEAVTGGNGTLTYTITPASPFGLTFDPSTRQLSGTPVSAGTETIMYKVVDADGDMTAADEDTLTFTITVTENTAPDFGTQMISDQNYINGIAITPLDLPEATGGTPPLEYSFTGLPAGLHLESGQLVGTPAEIVSGQTVTYTVTDADGDMTSGDEDTITFMITVAANTAPDFGSETIDDQSYIEGIAIPTLTLPAATDGNGDLTYSIAPESPFGLTFDPATQELSGTPSGTGPLTITYKVVDADGDMTSGDESTLTFTINVAEDTEPSFGEQMIGNLQYIPNSAITPVPLPAASGGNGPLTYSLPSRPDGFNFNAETRVLSGTPTTQGSTTMTYRVRDVNGDEDTLTFTIEVIADAMPGFAGQTIADQQYVQNVAITTLTLPAATGGNEPLTYSLTPLPDGIVFNSVTRELSGSPTTVGNTSLTYTARDADGDEEELTFMINVVTDAEPSFGSETIPAQNYINGIAITPLPLPVATGGNPPLEYSLTGQPAGLSLTGGQLVGTPAEVVSGQTAIYTATDVDGDVATLEFMITVAANSAPMFADDNAITINAIKGIEFIAEALPGATSEGNGASVYSVENRPSWLTFTEGTRTLSGTPPLDADATTTLTYRVHDGDGDTGASDSDTLTVIVNVADNDAPSFAAGTTINDQDYIDGVMIDELVLPAAMVGSGNGELSYSINPESPFGLTFNPDTRTLSGTPAMTGVPETIIYTVVDADGDMTSGDSATLTFTITVAADTPPNFGGQTIPAQSYIEDTAIDTLTLPEATGGNGELTYTLTPELPAGLTFNPAPDTREISGEPTAALSSTEYTYTVTDEDGDVVTLMFDVTVAANGAPSFAQDTAIAVPAINGIEFTHTLPEATGGNGALTYDIEGTVPSWLMFNADDRTISGTPDATGDFSVTYKVVDADGDMTDMDTATRTVTITVAANDVPSFGTQTINDRSYIEGLTIDTVTLPGATGGNENLEYSLPGLPDGIMFNSGTRELSGSPAAVGSTTVTYTVQDGDDDTGASDTATLEFTITVVSNDVPSFASGATIADQDYIDRVAITPLDLPVATGGNGPLEYSLTGLPAGLRLESGQLVGTPTEIVSGQTATYTAVDADGDTTSGDSATLTFTITVAADTPPSFGGQTIPAQSYIEDSAIDTLTLPEATGGNGALTYTLTPELPAGLTFDPAPDTRTISGEPTVALNSTEYTYTVTDADGDEATLMFDVTVTANEAPSFAAGTAIGPQNYINGVEIDELELPAAMVGSGNGNLSYSIVPESPFGLTFNPDTRILSGTPGEAGGPQTITYTVVDADGDMTATDESTLTFTINVAEDTEPSFDGQMIGTLQYVPNSAITPVPLPQARGGNGSLTYSLPSRPDGFDFNSETRVLSGTPTTVGITSMTYRVRDVNGDEDTITFTIEVIADPMSGIADAMPGFAGQTISSQQYIENVAITTFELPAATGGNGNLTYNLVPLPDGIVFNSVTRELSGSPTTVGSTSAVYTAHDADGDEAEITFTINVVEDTNPGFGTAMIDAPDYISGIEITPLDLPEAMGGNLPLVYSLTGQPAGLRLENGQLVGTPTEVVSGQTATYTAMDVNGDAATLTFTITVAANTAPMFADDNAITINAIKGIAITAEALPVATTQGNGASVYSVENRPSWLTFTAGTRQISGTPPSDADATTTLTYRVHDADGDTSDGDSDTLTVTLNVADNDAPNFAAGTRIEDQNYINGVTIDELALPEATVGSGNGELSYSIDPVSPFGLTFNPDTRTLSGTPAMTGGPETVTYTVMDADGDMQTTDEDTLMFTITVAADTPPNFGGQTVPAQNYIEDTAINTVTLPEATGGNQPLTYTLTPDLPAGLTFDPAPDTRTISGEPVVALISTEYTYTVTDANGDESTLMFNITVAANGAPSFTQDTAIAVPAINGIEFTHTLPEATGGNGALTYGIEGTVPSWLMFNADDRILSGTPSATGDFSVTYKVEDADGDMTDMDAATRTVTINIAANTAPDFGSQTINPQSYIERTEITTLMLPEATMGGNGELTYSMAPASPFGLMFNPATRELSGTPSGTGMETITYTVVDADGDTRAADEDSLSFIITVAVNPEPSFGTNTVPNQIYTQGIMITPLQLPQVNGGNAPLTYRLSPIPAGLVFNIRTRMLTGTPLAPFPSSDLTYTVQDAEGDTDAITFSVEVLANPEPSFTETIADQVYIQEIHRVLIPIDSVILPEAIGGNGDLIYSLAPLPDGMMFDSGTRTMSGSPTTLGSTSVTYRVRDEDGDEAMLMFNIIYRRSQTKNICSRTQQVQEYIISRIGGGTTCDSVSEVQLVSIYDLNLRDKSITSLKAGDFDGLLNLRWLRLHQNRLTSLPENIFDELLSGLITLDLSHNRLTSLPENIFDELSGLTRLSMSYNRISSLPEDIFDELSDLTTLELSHNRITSLPSDIFDRLSNLSVLRICCNNLTDLPEDIFDGLSDLTTLSMGGNGLTELTSDDFDGLSSLTGLYLANNSLTELTSDVFDGLSSLEVLRIGRNDLTTLPSDLFDGLSNLSALRICCNNLTTLPSDLFDGLSDLTILDLFDNGLTNPHENLFDGLSNLSELRMSGNDLTTLPEDMFDGLSDLTTLSLFNNNLATLHENLFDGLESLTELDLNYNSFETIPAAVFNDDISTLQVLNLGANKLTSTAVGDNLDSIVNMDTFADLNLQYNKLTAPLPAVCADSKVDCTNNPTTADASPIFVISRLPDQRYTKGVEITPLTLPEAKGGNGDLTYDLNTVLSGVSLPDGLIFDSATRVLRGTPTETLSMSPFRYTAQDADGDVATTPFGWTHIQIRIEVVDN